MSNTTESKWKIVDLMLDPICVVGEGHRLVYANESFLNLYGIPNRTLNRQPEVKDVQRFPKEIKELVESTSLDAERGGRYSEIGVTNADGLSTRMQVRIDRFDECWLVILHDVDIEYRLHMKYKEQLASNSSLIENLRGHLVEADFLRRVSLEFSPMNDESQILGSISQQMMTGLGLRQAAAIRYDGVRIVTESQSKRVHGSIRVLTNELKQAFEKFQETSSPSGVTCSIESPTGSVWVGGWINPRLGKPYLLTAMPENNEQVEDRRRFIGNLSAHVSTLLDSRSLYVASSSDSLTNVFNRRFFDSRLALECAKVSSEESVVSLILIDLDHFKKLNDTYGHPAGDQALKTAAARLKSMLRSDDIIARVGGEEFAVLLPGTPVEESIAVGEKLRKVIAQDPFELPSDGGETRQVAVTASFGLAELRAGMTMDPSGLYKEADTALYTAKAEGRNCVRLAKTSQRPQVA